MSAIQLTLSEAETAVWNRILDNDAMGHKLSQPVLDALLNRAYCIVKGIRDDRPRVLAPSGTGLLISSGTAEMTLTATNIRHILHVFKTSGLGTTTPAADNLAHWERTEVQRMQFEDTTQGEPRAFAAWRLGTATAADVGKWGVSFWRVPDTIYYFATVAVCDPTALSVGTDKFDVDPDVSQAIVDMTATIGARLVGRYDLAATLKEDVPAIFNSAFQQMEGEYFAGSGQTQGIGS